MQSLSKHCGELLTDDKILFRAAALGRDHDRERMSIEKYTMSQQFFFRRGPQITGKAIVFLKAYLSYTDI